MRFLQAGYLAAQCRIRREQGIGLRYQAIAVVYGVSGRQSVAGAHGVIGSHGAEVLPDGFERMVVRQGRSAGDAIDK